MVVADEADRYLEAMTVSSEWMCEILTWALRERVFAEQPKYTIDNTSMLQSRVVKVLRRKHGGFILRFDPPLPQPTSTRQ